MLDSSHEGDVELIIPILNQYSIDKNNIIYYLGIFSLCIKYKSEKDPISGFFSTHKTHQHIAISRWLWDNISKYMSHFCYESHYRSILTTCGEYKSKDSQDTITFIKEILRTLDPRGLTYSIKFWNEPINQTQYV